MNKNHKFYICKHCGNLIEMINDAGVKPVCCGEPMQELLPNKTDASQEKHVPVVEVKGNEVIVRIGSAAHPMVEDHFIQWVYLACEKGIQRKNLSPGQEPVAHFALTEDDKAVAAYEYCNLHGLWIKEI